MKDFNAGVFIFSKIETFHVVYYVISITLQKQYMTTIEHFLWSFHVIERKS